MRGINLITLLWTDGKKLVPTDYRRIYDKSFGGKTKNEHFRDMLHAARRRGDSSPTNYATIFDSWYTSLDNLRELGDMGWNWFARMKENRLVATTTAAAATTRRNLPLSDFKAISDIEIPTEGRVVVLKDYGPVKVFRITRKDGEVQYWATDDLKMDSKRGGKSSSRWGGESRSTTAESSSAAG